MEIIEPNQAGVAARTRRKIAWRLLPLIVLAAFFAFLDRVNIGFAAIQMQADLGLTATAYGLGAGIFFIGYTLLEVPSNLVMLRVGPGTWIARIMLTWGAISASTAFIPHISAWTGASHEALFYIIRFLLGAAEASFSPCIVYYIGLWFPELVRARTLAIYSAIVPMSALVGAPISGMLLDLHGLGLSGWQWMFLLEAIPAMAMAPLIFWRMTNAPAQATWLTIEEKEWLQKELAAEGTRDRIEHEPVLRVISNPRVLMLGIALFCVLCAFYAILFFLPQVIAAFGTTNRDTGLIGSLPYLASAFAMLAWGRHSDLTGERKWHFIASALIIPVGLVLAPSAHELWLKMLCLTLSAIGAFSCMPVFWPIAQQFMTGRAAAAGLAAINSLGNIGGFVSPVLMGAVRDRTGNFDAAFYVMALIAMFSVIMILSMPMVQPRPRASKAS